MKASGFIMKIWGDAPKVQRVTNRQNNIASTEKTKEVPQRKDEVSISSTAKDYQTVMKALKSVPDIRPHHVDELSKKYQSGSYNINSTDIADKIIKSVQDSES